MLPSTGYFKGIICPFNDNGLCERPYCHYRHLDLDESGAILQKLVSAAVIKALQQSDTSGVKSSARLTQSDTVTVTSTSTVTSSTKATYNPTPISELNKINSTDTENAEDPNEQRRRHIPVPYTPRKPSGLPLKRPVDVNDPKPFIYNPPGPPAKYKPGSTDNVQNDTYTPPGAVESKEKYLPGTETEIQQYTPDTNNQDLSSKLNYIPSSDKNGNKKKILEYKPVKVAPKTGKPLVTYQPTPRSLAPCFSSDEEEPETKKIKLSSDLNGFDDLGPEFDILGQILDEEETSEKEKGYKDNQSQKSKHSSKICKKSNGDISNTEKDIPHHRSKSEKDKSSDEHHKSKSEKDKSSDEHHKSKLEKKSADEKRKSKYDDNHKSKSDRKSSSDQNHKVKLDKKSSDENCEIKPDKKKENLHQKSKSEDNPKSHPDKKTDDHHRSSSDKLSTENHKIKANKEKRDDKQKKVKKHEHKKSSHKSSSKERERDKKNSSEKHSSDKKHSSKSSHSPKYSSSTKSEKHSDSRSSNNSKSTEKHSSKEKRHKKSKTKDMHRSEDKLMNSSDHEHMDAEDNGLGEEDYDLSDADEDAIALECKRIFEEYVPTEKPKSPDENERRDIEEEYIPGKKRVSRTLDKNIKITPRAPIKPDFKVSAANTMAERLIKVREFHTSRNIQSTNTNPSISNENCPKIELQKPSFCTPIISHTKIRIAHVPYASTLMNTKKTILPSQPTENIQASSSTTISQTVKKGAQRVAHMPSEKFIDRPGVLEPLASKIPANIRSIYLNMMIDECLKLYLSAHDAYARAQHEELNTSKKCCTVPIYKNSAVLAVSRLRKELVECNGVKKSGSDCSTGKPDSSLKAINSGSWSIESKNRKVYDNNHEFTGARFYDNIKKWVLTEDQLRENSFPRPHESGQRGRAVIYGQNKQNPPKGYLRTCCRCKKEYTVDKKGFPVVKEECIYHPSRKYRVRGEARYQCCSQDGSSDGCCIAPSHVYEYVNFENLKGYVRTMAPECQMNDYGVYSLDCEMCYTTNGLDLTRVTVINSSCKVVYETLIKPLHPIVDYNTRYSGITEEQMASVKTTLLEVQATLLAMFNSKTILVGHSLESDFKALKLIHDAVIDTSVLFPHKMGPPFKRALRNLSSEYLKKIIQNSVEGHDSAEDAMVCMELLHYKLREDLKTR